MCKWSISFYSLAIKCINYTLNLNILLKVVLNTNNPIFLFILFFFIFSPPAHICWHLLDVSESTIINCTTMNFGNKLSISLPSKDIKHEGTYHLNITIDNDVSKVQTQASFTVVVDKGLLNYYTYLPAS